MKSIKLSVCLTVTMMVVFAWCFAALAATNYTRQESRVENKTVGSVEYKYPGVYTVTAKKGDSLSDNATLGITEASKSALAGNPLVGQSPAIIMGAAVPYEKKNGPTDFNQFGTSVYGNDVYAPYSYFRWDKIYEPGMNGASDHWKMSGYDGSYFILRVDVNDLISGLTAEEMNNSYLHVKQEGNKALMVYPGHNMPSKIEGVSTFADSLGNKAYAFSLKNNAAALKDETGAYQDIPYVDVIIISSGTLVAGADTGAADTISADFNLKFYVDTTEDYNTDLNDYNAVPNPAPTSPTWDEMWLAKYYDESKAPAGTTFTSYKVKGSDLEIETVMYDNDPDTWGTGLKFWSLRQAMSYPEFDHVPIKLICEVPVLEGLKVDGGRDVILDVNSFDIQIANHQTTGAAALTVTGTGSKLTLQDSFNTTGAELAVGNNATMVIENGGVFVVDVTAQLEVEYDAASTAPSSGTTPPDYACGIITIRNGGEIINNGVITIEGTEGKPIDPANPSAREKKDAEFHIEAGGKLTNNGALLSYGALYNMGTVVNKGKYTETIESTDPDKGTFTYHKGIQISWKDDVTQEGVFVGRFSNGENQDGTVSSSARLENSGDILLCPGILWNNGVVENAAGGVIYVGEVESAVIPLDPPAVDKPFVSEEFILFGEPQRSYLTNNSGASFLNAGEMSAVSVQIVNNGRTGTLTPLNELNDLIRNMYFNNEGNFTNSGKVTLDYICTFGEMENTSAAEVKADILVSDNQVRRGRVTDSADTKLTRVYNAAKTTQGSTNIWTYAEAGPLSITPASQTGAGNTTVNWTAKVEAVSGGSEIQYYLRYKQQNLSADELHIGLTAGQEKTVPSHLLPEFNGNIVYVFWLDDGVHDGAADYNALATVTVSSDAVTGPSPVTGLVYNGQEQTLVTEGGAYGKTLEYRLGESGEWTSSIPAAKNAGDYQVYYRAAGETDVRGPVSVSIAKKEVFILANDLTSAVGAELKIPSYSVNGLPEGETLDYVSCYVYADINTPGSYPIHIGVKVENYPNYDCKCKEGTYTITATEFNVAAESVNGVYGKVETQGAAYSGYNIKLTIPEGATAYYSYDPTHPNDPVTLTNDPSDTKHYYKSFGAVSLRNLPAGAGTHTVAYFVISADESVWVSGTKQVIIEKAQQEAPKNITGIDESSQGAGNGHLTGLTPRVMEYRREGGNGVYATAYYDSEQVGSGTWLVRYKADDNHYASPDIRVTVGVGSSITVTFDSNGGSAVAPVTGLAFGDLVARPADPVRGELEFFGWYKEGEPYDFNRPVDMSFTLTAYWKGSGIPTPNTLYYTGKEQELVTAPEGALPDGYADIQYALGSNKDNPPASGWSSLIPAGTDTKVYYVWYKLIGEAGHADTAPECIQVRIQPTTRLVPYKAPTETENGNLAYYIGNDGKMYWDALGLAEILDPNEVILPATGKKEKPEPPVPDNKTDGSGTSNDSSGGQSAKRGTGKRGLIIISPDGTTQYLLGAGLTGSDSHWRLDAAGFWHYTYDNGRTARNEWVQISYGGRTDWYAFDEDGKMRTGWFISGGEHYYLEKLANGFQGAMVTGWKLIAGKWYYFETNPDKTLGRMYHGERTPDGFMVGEDGSWDGNPAANR